LFKFVRPGVSSPLAQCLLPHSNPISISQKNICDNPADFLAKDRKKKKEKDVCDIFADFL